jgi:hypothetical protein
MSNLTFRGPSGAESRPEESVEAVQYRLRPSPFQHCDLLSKGKDFEGRIAPTAKEYCDTGHERNDGFERELPLSHAVTRSVGPKALDRKLLISQYHGLFSTHR